MNKLSIILILAVLMPLGLSYSTHQVKLLDDDIELPTLIFRTSNPHIEWNEYMQVYETVWFTNYPSNTILSIQGYPDRGITECVYEHRYPIWHQSGDTLTWKGTSYKPCVWNQNLSYYQQTNTGWVTTTI